MSRYYQGLLWLVWFAILFAASLDYWRWDAPVVLGWLNLPAWLTYFIWLQLLFAVTLALFTYYFWKDKPDTE